MTTIAYREGLLVADSAMHQGDTLIAHFPKTARSPSGAIGAASGEIGAITRFRLWMQGDMTDPFDAKNDAFYALLIKPHGGVFCVDRYGTLTPLRGEFFADGSGAPIALGALAAGAGARRAVEIACAYDQNSGLPVQVEPLHLPKEGEPMT